MFIYGWPTAFLSRPNKIDWREKKTWKAPAKRQTIRQRNLLIWKYHVWFVNASIYAMAGTVWGGAIHPGFGTKVTKPFHLLPVGFHFGTESKRNGNARFVNSIFVRRVSTHNRWLAQPHQHQHRSNQTGTTKPNKKPHQLQFHRVNPSTVWLFLWLINLN